MKRLLSLLLASASACGVFTIAEAGVVFTIENAGVQQTTVAGALTETFDTHALGALGTFTSSAIPGTFVGGSVLAADQYGGANGTLYNLAGQNSLSTLTFSTPQQYVGMWWSAGDAGNQLEFYDSSSLLIATFNVGSIIPSLSSAYFGNPNAPLGRNTTEPYVYLNFTATGLSDIGSVVFRQTTGGGFEIDNVSVFDQRIEPPGHALPDGGSLLAVLTATVAGLAFIRRKLN